MDNPNPPVSYHLPLINDKKLSLSFPDNFFNINNPEPKTHSQLTRTNNKTCFLCHKKINKNIKNFFSLTCNFNKLKNYIKISLFKKNLTNTSIEITKILKPKKVYFHESCLKKKNISSKYVNECKISQINVEHIISNTKIPKIEITLFSNKLMFSSKYLNIINIAFKYSEKKKNNDKKIFPSKAYKKIDPTLKKELFDLSNNSLKNFNSPSEDYSLTINDIFALLKSKVFSFTDPTSK
jgi:hypothetical protein